MPEGEMYVFSISSLYSSFLKKKKKKMALKSRDIEIHGSNELN